MSINPTSTSRPSPQLRLMPRKNRRIKPVVDMVSAVLNLCLTIGLLALAWLYDHKFDAFAARSHEFYVVTQASLGSLGPKLDRIGEAADAQATYSAQMQGLLAAYLEADRTGRDRDRKAIFGKIEALNRPRAPSIPPPTQLPPAPYKPAKGWDDDGRPIF